jgi:hypothetical protein
MAAGRRARGGALHFPVRDARCYHLVFGDGALREWAWLDPTELAARAARWLSGRAEETRIALVRGLIDRGEAVRVETIDRPAGPPLPPVVQTAELGDVGDRLEGSTHVLRIEARNPAAPGVGYPGLWCATAVAGAAAAAGGVWFDALALRVRRPGDGATATVGAVAAGDHLLVTQRVSDPSTVRVATSGLVGFGLPELAVAEVPTSHGAAASLLLQALAQRLIDGLLDDLRDAARGVVPRELLVTSDHLARAVEGSRVRPGGAVRVALRHERGDHDDHLVVEPAAADAGRPRAEWMRHAVGDLLAG